MKNARRLLMIVPLLAPPMTARCQVPPDANAVDVGMNVGSVNDFATQSFFVDAMRQARPWGTPGTPWDQAASRDALGWPTQDAGAVILCCVADAAGHSLLAGTYQLRFSGSADVSLTLGGGTVDAKAYDPVANVTTATVTLADLGAGTSLDLSFRSTRRKPSSPLGSGFTGASLIRPAMAPNGRPWWTRAGQVFTTPYLDLLRPFDTLRFMDFTATNGSPATTWALRTTPAMATQQTPQGASWEYAVRLADALHHDMWVNIPDQADDAYVASLADLVARTLDPGLNVWVEYSNEVWNYSFAQASRNQAAAEAEVAADPASPLAIGCADLAACRYEWGERRIGLKAVQAGAAFRKAFGAGAARVRPVFATQVGQTYFVSLVISMIQATMGKPSDQLYAIAQAPYWTGDNSIDGLTPGQELSAAAASLAEAAQPERAFAAWAAYYGLRSVTYEGGPGMSGTASLASKVAANRSPAMAGLVARSVRQAAANGIGPYMHYDDSGQYGQYGMWGTTEDVFDLASPKLRGLAAARRDGSERLTAGSAVPSVIDATKPDLCPAAGQFTEPAYIYLRPGAICGYLVSVPADGTRTVTLGVGNYGAATTATLQVDQAPAATFTVPANGFAFGPTAPAAVAMTAGLHVLSVSATGAEFGVSTLTIR